MENEAGEIVGLNFKEIGNYTKPVQRDKQLWVISNSNLASRRDCQLFLTKG